MGDLVDKAAGTFLQYEIVGAVAIILAVALTLTVHHIVKLYARIDKIREEQNNDIKVSLQSVTKAVESVAGVGERMETSNIAMTRIIALWEAQYNRGRD